MEEDLLLFCDKLDELSRNILSHSANTGEGQRGFIYKYYSTNAPAVNGQQMAAMALDLSVKIRATQYEENEISLDHITDAIASLSYLQQSVVPFIFTWSSSQAATSFVTTLQCIRVVFEKKTDWQVALDKGMLPKDLSRKLRSIDTDIKQIIPQKEELEQQIGRIKDAYEAAENLPVDLQRLREAGEQVQAVSKQAFELYGGIKDYPDQIKKELDEIQAKNQEAQGLVKQSQEAYRITTSIGLAGAFDERASKSETAMWVWVGALIVALGLGAWLGGMRVNELIESLKATNPNWGIITIHSIITLLSFGSPIWFAWLSTKQIGHRFRLSEDYAYKASIAKAYEGFRQEAARIDPEFESRLFGSTLTRFDEAPIRLFDNDMHGSPWHELFASKAFQNLLKTAPGFKDELLQLIKDKFPSYGASDKAGKTRLNSDDNTNL